MNLRFWKKKPASEKNGADAAGETIVADETGPKPKPVKLGWLARLKGTLKSSRKKSAPVVEGETEHPATPSDKNEPEPHPKDSDERTDGKHPAEELEQPAKPSFLARLRKALLPSRKKSEPDAEEAPGHAGEKTSDLHPRKSGAREDKNPEGEEPEPPAGKPGKRKWILLAFLILLAGSGFAAWKWLLPPPDHKTPPAAAQKQESPAAAPEPNTPDAAALTAAAEKAQAEATALAEAAAKAQAEEAAKAEEAAQARAEAEAAAQAKAAADQAATESQPGAAPASANTDVQAQLEALKKQNQEMKAQIEALKNRAPLPTRPTGAASPSRGEVLIINGKNTKESTQSLKNAIEEMNAAAGIKGGQKPSK